MNAKLLPGWAALAAGLFLAGCNYDFPLTAQPTRRIDDRLLGEWIAVDKESAKPDHMKVRKLDDSTYIVAYNTDLYRAFHSDFARTPFVSVQDLDSDERKFVYFVWQLSPDGKELRLKGVTASVIPEKTKSPAEMHRLIKRNLSNPAMYTDEIQFVREKAAKS